MRWGKRVVLFTKKFEYYPRPNKKITITYSYMKHPVYHLLQNIENL